MHVLSRRVRYKGRCSGWLRCCDPRDPRPSDQCKKRHLKTARKLALEGLANAKSNGSQPLTLIEFHWPDSGLGWPHGALTFLDLVPMMRALPCRTVLVTVLRAPADLCTRPGCPSPRVMALLTDVGLCACRQTFRFTSAHGAHRRMAHFGRHFAPAHGAHLHLVGSTRRPATLRPSRLRSRTFRPIACRHGSGHRPCCPRWGTRPCTEGRCGS